MSRAGLGAGRGCVLDLGCGSGHSSLAVAAALPGVTVLAVDCDQTSIDQARTNVAAAEAEGRVGRGQVCRYGVHTLQIWCRYCVDTV